MSESVTQREWLLSLKAFVLLALLIIVAWICPSISFYGRNVLPARVDDALFFVPQYLLLPGSAFIWVPLLVMVAWSARRLRLWQVVGIGILSVLLCTVLLHLAFNALGVRFQLDGP
jgi:hypothetical protein